MFHHVGSHTQGKGGETLQSTTRYTATHCNALQRTATRCNTHYTTHCKTLYNTMTQITRMDKVGETLQCTATRCNRMIQITRQGWRHTATHTATHNATRCSTMTQTTLPGRRIFPPKKLLGSRISTPCTLYWLICIIMAWLRFVSPLKL